MPLVATQVESVLLFCAVLVNLAGVMFESGRFSDGLYSDQVSPLLLPIHSP